MAEPEETTLTQTESELHDSLVHRVQRRIETIEEELGGKIRTALVPELAGFKNELRTYVIGLLDELGEHVENIVRAHLAKLLPTTGPIVAPAVQSDSSVVVVEPPPAASALAELQTAEELNPDRFPTLEQFTAMGFYADTYAFQKAEWEARKNPPAEGVEPSSDVQPSQTAQENAPSDSATSAGSETA